MLNVPTGQLIPNDPAGQYCPSGHTYPDTPSTGLGVAAPRMQTYPGEQTEEGSIKPESEQYIPGGHRIQSDEL